MDFNDISSQDYVDLLLTEGEKIRCDNTNEAFKTQTTLPSYYDKRLFKRGQKFINKHLYAMGLSQTFGLISIYAISSIINVLRTTTRNSTALAMYKRQIPAFFIMDVLYTSDCEPGSKFWKAISFIKHMHNSSSKGSIRADSNPINQKDMVLSQFLFLGFPLVRGEMCGFHGITKEEQDGFIHFWRVVGYLLGIEERFNLCSFPTYKVIDICDLLIDQAFRPEIQKKLPLMIETSNYVCTAVSTVIPELTTTFALNHVYNMVQKKHTIKKIPDPIYLETNFIVGFYYKCMVFMMVYLMSFSIFRSIKNGIYVLNILILRTFPIFSFFKYGIADSFINFSM